MVKILQGEEEENRYKCISRTNACTGAIYSPQLALS